MCGIAGVLGPPDDRPETVAAREAQALAMIERIAHRGPDGVRVEAVRGSALAHARLSIIDLEGGWQPLHAAGCTVVGNGEIYNYVELIEEFGLQDRLKTGSDFEPLLYLYALEGEKAFARLRGMYAFCLIGGDGRTWLVRDPFGIKPLYVDWTSDLAFASERRSLKLGSIGSQKAVELLTLGYGVEEGGLAALPQIAPDSVLEWVGGELVSRGALHPIPAHPRGSGDPGFGRSPTAHPNLGTGRAAAQTWVPASAGMSGSEGEWIARLDAVLEDSVRVHQRSDVPYGLFLSGGVDSTAIATLMSRLNTRPVTAFTCGFDIPEAADERTQAERVAKALNLDWRETTFTTEDFWRIAPQVAWALDDPTTDYACLPTYKLAEAAKGVLTVVLSGEGGDELFAGYGRYRRALRPKWLGGRPAEPQIDAPFLKPRGKGLAKLMPDLETLPGEYHEPLLAWREAACLGRPDGLTPLQQAQWADIATWLPNDLLLKLDRMLMAHGLEGRTPFLDREVAAFAWSLPDRLKVRGRHGKWILRKWLERACPAAEPWARKQGFTVPVARWIAPRAADLGPRIAAVPGVAEVCDAEKVRALFAAPDGAKHWWPLMFYALWWTIHVGGASPQEAAEALSF